MLALRRQGISASQFKVNANKNPKQKLPGYNNTSIGGWNNYFEK